MKAKRAKYAKQNNPDSTNSFLSDDSSVRWERMDEMKQTNCTTILYRFIQVFRLYCVLHILAISFQMSWSNKREMCLTFVNVFEKPKRISILS